MTWHKSRQIQLGQHRRSVLRRAGSVIIEAVIAVMLLATATYGLAKLASSSAALSQQADQRLAATLAAENTVERLRRLPLEKLSEQAGDVAEGVAKSSACEVKVSTESFTLGAGMGIHVRVDVSPSKTIRVTLHDWRLTTEESDRSDVSDSDTANGSTGPDTLPSGADNA